MIYNQENCKNVPFFWKIYLLHINCKYKITKNIYRSLTGHVASDAETVTM